MVDQRRRHAQRKAASGMTKSKAATTAAETLDLFDKGWYHSPSGAHITVKDVMARCAESTRLYLPRELVDSTFAPTAIQTAKDTRLARAVEAGQETAAETKFSVTPMTTIAAIQSMADDDTQANDIFALNFASAKNAGGGFLGGARAQEESLARSSGLYISQTLSKCNRYYQENRKEKTCIYTDHMIISPACPLICDDDGVRLEKVIPVTFITAPAVNTGVVIQRQSTRRPVAKIKSMIRERMKTRMGYVLSIAASHAAPKLVLGAYGCGVFRNDPKMVADLFHELLLSDFKNCFDEVMFAIPGRVAANLEAFQQKNWVSMTV